MPVLLAVLLARLAVPLLSTGVRIVAAVLPLRPLDLDGRRVHQRGYVSCEASPPYCDREGTRQDAVDLENAAGGEALFEYRGIGGVQVLRGEPIEAMLAEERHDPTPRLGSVVRQRARHQFLEKNQALADHIEELRHPFGNGRSTSRLAHAP
ncbi:hypothetical protein ACWEPL_35745 [Nonomuraea sp. NPDC004186]